MPISNDSLNKNLYNLLKTRGFKPQPKDSSGKTIPLPTEADVFKFDFTNNMGKVLDSAWITIEDGNTLKVYYDDDIMALSESEDGINEFTKFLTYLKNWAQSRQLGFELENEDHLASDMAKRDYMKKENILEGYHPMGSRASYNDSVPSVKIVLQHTRQIQEGEQRFRNIARIFLENTEGERILAPTVRPGIAQVYARHLAEGGVPNDERWNHIKSLCEEYSKMAGFVRAVRNNQFNESAQKLVEAGLNHYTGLRESLGKMRGHRGYNAYFESWTPTLMETEGDETNLNELFVQETLDPRIESVIPILNKLSKTLGEMKEVIELEEWADSLTEAPGAETLAHNEKTEKQRMRAFDLEENNDAEAAHKKTQMPAFMRKQSGDPDWKTTTKDLEKAKERNISGKEGLAALTKRLQDIGSLEEAEVEESGLQAYLGNKKYGKEGMDALRKAGREHAGKEKMASIRAKYDKLDEVEMDEGFDVVKKGRLVDLIDMYRDATEPNGYYDRDIEDPDEVIAMIRKEFGDKIASQVEAGAHKMHFPRDNHSLGYDPLGWKPKGDHRVTKAGKMFKQDSDYMKNTIKSRYKLGGKSATHGGEVNLPEEGMAEGDNGAKYKVKSIGHDSRGDYYISPSTGKKVYKSGVNKGDHENPKTGEIKKGMAEDLDANQKRVGQLGPTEKVKNNNIGKLVGANESKLNEMDSEGYKGHRGDEDKGKGPEKKATPAKAKDVAKDAEKELTKSMDKAHKKDVKEGQDDLEALLRLIK